MNLPQIAAWVARRREEIRSDSRPNKRNRLKRITQAKKDREEAFRRKERLKSQNTKSKKNIRDKWNNRIREIKNSTAPGKSRDNKIRRAKQAKKNALDNQKEKYAIQRKLDLKSPESFEQYKLGILKYSYKVQYFFVILDKNRKILHNFYRYIFLASSKKLKPLGIYKKFLEYLETIDIAFKPGFRSKKQLDKLEKKAIPYEGSDLYKLQFKELNLKEEINPDLLEGKKKPDNYVFYLLMQGIKSDGGSIVAYSYYVRQEGTHKQPVRT